MNVKNFTQMAHLLSSKQLGSHPAFNKLIECMNLYNAMCSCGGNSNKDKSNKGNECNRIYRECLGIVDSIKANLFSGCADNTINFYIDDVNLVKTLHR